MFVLLDVEVGFPHIVLEDNYNANNIQIDLLFLDVESGRLYFIEAKEYTDIRLKAETRDG